MTTGNDDMSFDASQSSFVAPALGFYQFFFSVTCSQTSGQSATIQLLVDGKQLYSSFSGCQDNQTQTISGSTLVQLLPGQKVTLAASTPGGPCRVVGPTTAGAPPYPTIFSGFSFF